MIHTNIRNCIHTYIHKYRAIIFFATGRKRERLRDRAVPVPPEADAVSRAAELPAHVQARRVHLLQERSHGGADGVVSE